MKFLLVEDDTYTCEAISQSLSAYHYVVDMVADGEAGLEMAIQWPYDLILLDVTIPKLNGIEVCRRLRARKCGTPIMFLTAKGTNEDVIAGLDAGADDYVVKSCGPAQLIARVRALLRRSGNVISSPLLTWGGLCLDPSLARVTFNQNHILCRPKEYALLELFLRNPQRLLSRSNIIDHLWSCADAPVEGAVTTLVKDLRRRLKEAGMAKDPIETVYGLGYRLNPAPQSDAIALPVEPSGRTTAAVIPAPVLNDARARRLKVVLHQMNDQVSRSELLAVLELIEQSLRGGNCTRAQQQTALDHIHRLVGSLNTFGYDKAVAVAEALEESINQYLEQEAQWSYQFSEMLADLKQELAQLSVPSATMYIYPRVVQN